MGGYAADEEARPKLDEAFQPVPLSVPTLPQSLLFPEKYGPGRILSGVLAAASTVLIGLPIGDACGRDSQPGI
ncbi:hypothetical protein RE6C_01439 [Rhodopirellula europaea 6C]|uniref:Uncharacterized protein n=2 Tax=Rhodopirellula TaxID=265488 RepID=M2B7V4_9BACT|nr:hypothetical protein RE6C_01439 [Rhodopirellula europaea 6C]